MEDISGSHGDQIGAAGRRASSIRIAVPIIGSKRSGAVQVIEHLADLAVRKEAVFGVGAKTES